jgi:serine phosphatase RsbU (regulator of sigma subunit)
LDVAKRFSHLTADSLLKEIIRQVKEFTGDGVQSDDITVIVLSADASVS